MTGLIKTNLMIQNLMKCHAVMGKVGQRLQVILSKQQKMHLASMHRNIIRSHQIQCTSMFMGRATHYACSSIKMFEWLKSQIFAIFQKEPVESREYLKEKLKTQNQEMKKKLMVNNSSRKYYFKAAPLKLNSKYNHRKNTIHRKLLHSVKVYLEKDCPLPSCDYGQ